MSGANVAHLLDCVMRTIERSLDCRSNAARSRRARKRTPHAAARRAGSCTSHRKRRTRRSPGGRMWVVDVHHRSHPVTKNEDGLHGISLGFTSHYDAIARALRDRVMMGCAGENIIATSDRQFGYDDLAAGVAILSPEGKERVRLKVLEVAIPADIHRMALGKTVEPEELKKPCSSWMGG